MTYGWTELFDDELEQEQAPRSVRDCYQEDHDDGKHETGQDGYSGMCESCTREAAELLTHHD